MALDRSTLPDYSTYATPPHRQGILNVFPLDPDEATSWTLNQRYAGGILQFLWAFDPGVPPTDATSLSKLRAPLQSESPIEVGSFFYVHVQADARPVLLFFPGNPNPSHQIGRGMVLIVKTGRDRWAVCSTYLDVGMWQPLATFP